MSKVGYLSLALRRGVWTRNTNLGIVCKENGMLLCFIIYMEINHILVIQKTPANQRRNINAWLFHLETAESDVLFFHCFII